ncbi:hypothetical protein Daus18300_006741 [Diaporthe australafricana]|uniref:EGF-like domain-containing protein n=1 Tax=Diaporthe australafricana TaxID=127596 RepID=A0ABR3WS56_9PEZI
MPESWGTPSPAQSPLYGDAFYDDTIVEESSPSEVHSMQDYGDESRLVRSASIGRRGKAALVTTGSREATGEEDKRPSPTPMQPSPFDEGTGYLEASSNSSTTVPSAKSSRRPPLVAALTADDILNAYDAASAVDSRTSRRMSASSQPAPPAPLQPRAYSRLSAIRRPPRLDIDAVRDAEARGSLTSLPDLIRRATRLAASLDRGKRPASRLNDLDDFPVEFYGAGTKSANVDKESDEYYDNHQSGFSDMLAAFPPPAQAQSRQGGIRQSIRDSVMSWPLPPLNRNNNNSNNNPTPRLSPDDMSSNPDSNRKKGRRCCGLPLWGFITIVVIVVILIAAAVIIPIEFFVIRRQNVNTQAEAEQQCQRQVTCQNGGTNVVINGFCSCICINNFTGFDCSVADNIGCTTATISGDTNISNVTVGNALPRLIAQAQTNFSVPLSGTTILSKLNAGNLSCSAENALVTLNGQSTVLGTSAEAVTDMTGGSFDVVNAVALQEARIATITVMAGQSTTTTLTIEISDTPATSLATTPTTMPTTTITITRTFTSSWPPPSLTSAPTLSTASSSLVTPSPVPPSATNPGSVFTVTNDVLDFARVGILFVLQQDSVADASTAQTALQTFLTSSSATIASASNVTLSSGNSIDLVNFRVDAGTGLVGSRNTATTKRALEEAAEAELWDRDWMR